MISLASKSSWYLTTKNWTITEKNNFALQFYNIEMNNVTEQNVKQNSLVVEQHVEMCDII